MEKLEQLKSVLKKLLTDKIKAVNTDRNELTITVEPSNIVKVLTILRDNQLTSFEQCIDLCAVDYLDYKNAYVGDRFAVVYHLLSIKYNWRLRIKTFLKDDENPTIATASEVYSSVSWFEREAFDLYGIVFVGHTDLRRILTDYGFIGHPFRKDFPVSGYVEMKYDEDKKRVVYQPVTIEPREIVPKVVREEGYNGGN